MATIGAGDMLSAMQSQYEPGEMIDLTYLKWPNDLHYRMRATVVEESDLGTWLSSAAGAPIDHGPKGVLPARAKSVILIPQAKHWTARWYDVVDRGRGGRVDRYACYVDITTEARRTSEGIEVDDLDLDVVLTWEGDVQLLDEDDFEVNRVARGYPGRIVAAASAAVAEVTDLLQSAKHPFDASHARMMQYLE